MVDRASEGTRAKFNATLKKKLPPHCSPVWLLGCNLEDSFSVQPLAQTPLPDASGSAAPQPRAPSSWEGSRSRGATVPRPPCPSHHLWLQIRSDGAVGALGHNGRWQQTGSRGTRGPGHRRKRQSLPPHMHTHA
uniref:Uncharacterized protein n=1 Tax=Pipistrellus kuhlii TaxID=59472 RepID=A0A7J7ZIY8_PIPKU|nr:hypothetical protein mPipKuh1_009460 [Pipistrellus kuhlii]